MLTQATRRDDVQGGGWEAVQEVVTLQGRVRRDARAQWSTGIQGEAKAQGCVLAK